MEQREVAQFLNKNPTLRSLSKVDRQIIALAHTLELQHEGTKHVATNHKKAASVHGGKASDKSKRPQIKKSKTGRIHTQAQPIPDTGLRLARMKKVIPFHFDDFLTFTEQQCMLILLDLI